MAPAIVRVKRTTVLVFVTTVAPLGIGENGGYRGNEDGGGNDGDGGGDGGGGVGSNDRQTRSEVVVGGTTSYSVAGSHVCTV